MQMHIYDLERRYEYMFMIHLSDIYRNKCTYIYVNAYIRLTATIQECV